MDDIIHTTHYRVQALLGEGLKWKKYSKQIKALDEAKLCLSGMRKLYPNISLRLVSVVKSVIVTQE